MSHSVIDPCDSLVSFFDGRYARSVKKKILSQLIYDDPAYSDLARLVGYREARFPLGKDESQALLTKYGKDKMMQVAEVLLEFVDSGAKVRRGAGEKCSAMLLVI